MLAVEALTEALTGTPDPPPPPVTQATPDIFNQVLDYAGGTAPAAARVLNALDPRHKLPDPGTPERRRYEADKRNLERYRKWADDTPGQRRTPTAATIETLRRRAITARKDRLIEKIRRRGARARIYARILDETPNPGRQPAYRDRVIPPGGPGQYLPPTVTRTVTDLFLDDHLADATDTFLDTFLDLYGFPEAELDDIYSLKLWPDGDPEPPG